MKRRIRNNRAFNLLELLIVLAVVGILLIVLLGALTGAPAKAKRIKCVGRLGTVGTGYRIFATDHGDLFPWQVDSNSPVSLGAYVAQIRSLSNQISTPKILICPSDTRKAAPDWSSLSSTNLSYFSGVSASESFPQSILAGDRNITTNTVRVAPGIVKLASNTKLGWDGTMHRFQGHALMGDGSVQQISNARWSEQLANTGQTSMIFAVP